MRFHKLTIKFQEVTSSVIYFLGKIEVEYDQDVVYGKPSKSKENRTKTVEAEMTKQNQNDCDVHKLSVKKQQNKKTVDDVIHEDEEEFLTEDNEIGKKKNKNYQAGMRKENQTEKLKTKASKQDQFDAGKIKENKHYMLDNNSCYNNLLDHKNKNTLLRPTPDNNNYHNNIYSEFSNVKNYQPANLAIPQQIGANKQLRKSTPFNINPFNKNFEILLGHSASNEINPSGNHPQNCENFNPRPDNFINNQINRSFAQPYNNINSRNSMELNQSNQYNPYYTQNYHLNSNPYFSTPNHQNYYPFNNTPNTSNYICDNNSQYSYQSHTGVNPVQSIAPYSCANCEHIYRNSIFNNIPLSLMKCICCNNVINSVSLDFYLKKYREDLVNNHRKNLPASNDLMIFHNEAREESVINRDRDRREKIEVEPEKFNEDKHHRNEGLEIKRDYYQGEGQSLSTSVEVPQHHHIGKARNGKKHFQPNEEGIKEINRVDDDWVEWIEKNKTEIKKNIAFTISFNTNKKEKSSEDPKLVLGEKVNSKNDKILNEEVKLSEMFKNNKKEFLKKIEKRKKNVKNENMDIIPALINSDIQEVGKNEIAPKEDRKLPTDSKLVESININEKQQEKNPQVKNF